MRMNALSAVNDVVLVDQIAHPGQIVRLHRYGYDTLHAHRPRLVQNLAQLGVLEVVEVAVCFDDGVGENGNIALAAAHVSDPVSMGGTV